MDYKKYFSEFLGTMILVLFGCGAAISIDVVGNLGVAIAFGLAIVAVAYSLGRISGAHLNPAVTMGMYISKRISIQDTVMYIIFQIIGAIVASIVLAIIFGADSGLGINTIQDGHTAIQGIIFELVFTWIFVFVILAVTSKDGSGLLSGLVIGGTLTAIILVGIPVTGTSLNPARSIGPALISMDGVALSQLYIFIIVPLIGGALASLTWKVFEK